MDGFKDLRRLSIVFVIHVQIHAGDGDVAVIAYGQKHIVVAAGLGQGFGEHVAHQLQARHQLEIEAVKQILAAAVLDGVEAFVIVGQEHPGGIAVGIGHFQRGDHEGLGEGIHRRVVPHAAHPEQACAAVFGFARRFDPIQAFAAKQVRPLNIGARHGDIVIPDLPIVVAAGIHRHGAHQAVALPVLGLLYEEGGMVVPGIQVVPSGGKGNDVFGEGAHVFMIFHLIAQIEQEIILVFLLNQGIEGIGEVGAVGQEYCDVAVRAEEMQPADLLAFEELFIAVQGGVDGHFAHFRGVGRVCPQHHQAALGFRWCNVHRLGKQPVRKNQIAVLVSVDRAVDAGVRGGIVCIVCIQIDALGHILCLSRQVQRLQPAGRASLIQIEAAHVSPRLDGYQFFLHDAVVVFYLRCVILGQDAHGKQHVVDLVSVFRCQAGGGHVRNEVIKVDHVVAVVGHVVILFRPDRGILALQGHITDRVQGRAHQDGAGILHRMIAVAVLKIQHHGHGLFAVDGPHGEYFRFLGARVPRFHQRAADQQVLIPGVDLAAALLGPVFFVRLSGSKECRDETVHQVLGFILADPLPFGIQHEFDRRIQQGVRGLRPEDFHDHIHRAARVDRQFFLSIDVFVRVIFAPLERLDVFA